MTNGGKGDRNDAEGDGGRGASYASPPCYMHEVDPAYMGLDDTRQQSDVQRWRKAERERLIDLRLAQTVAEREARDRVIRDGLAATIGPVSGRTIGIYWPFRGEPNLMELLRTYAGEGATLAMPVVIRKGEPLVFRQWTPGDAMARGVWNIPVPLETAPEQLPDVVISPVVGYDPKGYRLGYGGGFYDRTLAQLGSRARAIGVGYSLAAIASIYPQWHDIPLSAIVTEEGLVVQNE